MMIIMIMIMTMMVMMMMMNHDLNHHDDNYIGESQWSLQTMRETCERPSTSSPGADNNHHHYSISIIMINILQAAQDLGYPVSSYTGDKNGVTTSNFEELFPI